ncbi:hypothetical protein DDB_G0267986 [Dictyostelium discoideum AX4]|uniref:Uncharacterized protein n=1 Tax=Dictyostelium discoideum TaxID=44689 RepID=Q55FR7_DICDI|nr:hypothetical protein DDB_G0267986 [Dictyostelium discoideum AX4]EAL73446.1 hypothetical protein DDB_G0267986 [Dictyostelium discoideum AX4]|eukprot:XP_647466.1 hypothetical protein DDB_G0267986 [Dictyostelium discoideum AX4]
MIQDKVIENYSNGIERISKKSFPDYIDYKIIKSIIDFLLIPRKRFYDIQYFCENEVDNKNNNNNNNNNNKNNSLKLKNNYNNNNNINNNSNIIFEEYLVNNYKLFIDEIIDYSLVSKKWNKYISTLISNSIVDNNLIEYWFTPERIKKLFVTNKLNKSFSLEINKKHSIIKIEKKIVIDYFNKKVLMINQCEFIKLNKRQIDGIKLKFNKIVIELFGNEIVYKYMNQASNFENGNNDFKMELNINNFSLDENEFIGFGVDTKIVNINKIQLFGANELQILDFIRYLQPKHLTYDPNGCYSQDSYYHMDYSPLFNPEIIGDRIESIKVIGYSDHVEPYCLKTINKLRNLHTLSIPILCHDLIKLLSDIDLGENGCDYHYGPLEKTNNLKEDWDQMIDSVLTCKSLRNLTLSNFCSDGEFCLKCDDEHSEKIINSKKQLSDGIKKLLKSDYLYYLKLDDIDFVEESTFSPLLENFSLKVLVLKFRCINHTMHEETYLNHCKIIQFILSNQININHLKISLIDGLGSKNSQFDTKLISLIFNTLLNQQKNNIKTNLYSIGLVIQKEQFDQVFNYFKLFSDSTFKTTPIIKEYYLSFTYPVDNEYINSLKDKIKNIDCKKGIVININK